MKPFRPMSPDRYAEAAAATRVRSLTVVPPWSLAIVRGWKPVENRTQNLAGGGWRGRVLILSGATNWDDDGARFIGRHAPRPVEGPDEPPVELSGPVQVTREECHPGHYIGAVTLVDVHRQLCASCNRPRIPDHDADAPGPTVKHPFRPPDGGCCQPWGQPGLWHHMWEDADEFTIPVAATGHLGLRWVTNPAYLRLARGLAEADPSF